MKVDEIVELKIVTNKILALLRMLKLLIRNGIFDVIGSVHFKIYYYTIMVVQCH